MSKSKRQIRKGIKPVLNDLPAIDKNKRAAFFEAFPVSHETQEKFDRYAELLMSWSQRMNLVAPSTLPDLWQRHFLDSAQLMRLIGDKDGYQDKVVLDVGTGAGFPGLVLSIMGQKNVLLIESIGKKAEFLSHVIDDLKLTATLHHGRAEDYTNLRADIVTARAVKNLRDLVGITRPFLRNKESYCLFPKGAQFAEEIADAEQQWKFGLEKFPSLSDNYGIILKLWHIEKNFAASHNKNNNNFPAKGSVSS
jgi:16S rRNA (guanine527-N7)-methyltransferase